MMGIAGSAASCGLFFAGVVVNNFSHCTFYNILIAVTKITHSFFTLNDSGVIGDYFAS